MEKPFIGREAIDGGSLTRHRLRSHYAALYPGIYLPIGADITPRQRAEAAWLWS